MIRESELDVLWLQQVFVVMVTMATSMQGYDGHMARGYECCIRAVRAVCVSCTYSLRDLRVHCNRCMCCTRLPITLNFFIMRIALI